MKTYQNYINDGILNLSKTRKFPKLGERDDFYDKKWNDNSDLYKIYHTNKHDIGKYLNTWFRGRHAETKKYVTMDEMWIVKKVDNNTASNLYNRVYNPIGINITCPTGAKFKQNEQGEDLYQMAARIYSIDDSSYGIWFYGITYLELEEIRIQIMKWINNKPIINGDEFLQYCVSVGGDEPSIDYN